MSFKSNPENNPHFRNCPNSKNNPSCDIIIYYHDKYSLKRQEVNNSECRSCTRYLIPRPPSVGIAVSKARKGKPLSEEHKRKVRENANPYERTDEHRKKASENIRGEKNYFYGRNQSGANNPMFGSSIYKKWVEKFGQSIADEKWKEMYDKREYKLSGQDLEYEEWKITRESLRTEFEKYRKRVEYFTNKHDLTEFLNYKKRGPGGKEGAYHLDHIVSVLYGFVHQIDPDKIGSAENLRFIPWEGNLKKQAKLHGSDMNHYYSLQYYNIAWYVSNLLKSWGHEIELPKLKRIENAD